MVDEYLIDQVCAYCGCKLVLKTTPETKEPYYRLRLHFGKKNSLWWVIELTPGYGIATIDHKMPQSRGGSDDPSNLVWCCKRCNCSKNDLTDHEYIDYLRDVRPQVWQNSVNRKLDNRKELRRLMESN